MHMHIDYDVFELLRERSPWKEFLGQTRDLSHIVNVTMERHQCYDSGGPDEGCRYNGKRQLFLGKNVFLEYLANQRSQGLEK